MQKPFPCSEALEHEQHFNCEHTAFIFLEASVTSSLLQLSWLLAPRTAEEPFITQNMPRGTLNRLLNDSHFSDILQVILASLVEEICPYTHLDIWKVLAWMLHQLPSSFHQVRCTSELVS